MGKVGRLSQGKPILPDPSKKQRWFKVGPRQLHGGWHQPASQPLRTWSVKPCVYMYAAPGCAPLQQVHSMPFTTYAGRCHWLLPGRCASLPGCRACTSELRCTLLWLSQVPPQPGQLVTPSAITADMPPTQIQLSAIHNGISKAFNTGSAVDKEGSSHQVWRQTCGDGNHVVAYGVLY